MTWWWKGTSDELISCDKTYKSTGRGWSICLELCTLPTPPGIASNHHHWLFYHVSVKASTWTALWWQDCILFSSSISKWDVFSKPTEQVKICAINLIHKSVVLAVQYKSSPGCKLCSTGCFFFFFFPLWKLCGVLTTPRLSCWPVTRTDLWCAS